MTARILQFPSWTNPSDDDLAILIKTSIKLGYIKKTASDNAPLVAIMSLTRG